ncbi:chromosome partitioning protein ParB [Helicobacter cinaedi PAGU611]|uniref:Chromosome partitioning protein n=1 Tax=Helicobacter cinaedi CCUG 18818 = ATCC BAA-847 TaxID=537971 RepID=A0AAI8MN30_9HELI|nr:ParB/RepB/Spo0J family partition protein [Helicobacter cinaedi]AWK61523.1 ParB/RepB/Spo0J family partition protein [Helicobacter cinaedi]EFR47622.1 putative stage 0 sporulation protein J [Helicobacter cinaedi CCUG 18818 = ATCC BAA-847]QOQ91437.1 ParB/RepB/Spo0J family partition protein [Helicobacter cinaedi]QOQ95628.1 ParB/RepB/Spo0J family partition protein [Helicobacter cinaedi]BAM11952.1 chromosome partitioning protein ParB [Helicobacter cinaedi PAGU611]
MAKKKLAIGRGLGAILAETAEAYEQNLSDNSSLVLDLDIDIIKPNPYQPRKTFNQEALQELSESIKEHGLLQPIVVYDNGDGDYVLIAGERRLRASKLAGLSNIRAIVAEIEQKKMRELAIIENIQREELNAIELALSYQELLEEYDITHEELSKRINKSRTQITNTLRLLQLCDEVKTMLGEEKITQGHAKMLVTLSESEQKLVADSIIGQRLSVRDTETLIKKLKNGQDSTAKDSISKAKPKGQAKSLDISLLEELRMELSSLGIQSSINATKLSIDFKSDAEITTLLKKIAK